MSVDDEAQWKDVWKLYDLDKDDKVTRADFLSAVRVCGRRYTNDQMNDKTKNFGDIISYDTFFGFMCDPYTGPTPDDLRNALRAFDGKDCGELTVAQIQSMLTTMGDKLTLDEVKPVLDAMPAQNEKISIDALVTFLTPPVPNSNPNVPELMRELMREEAAKAGLPLYEPKPGATPTPAAAPAAAPAPAAPAPAAKPAKASEGGALDIPGATVLESDED
jgi:Ca2+-binding EF-hand superfamily protein